MRILYHHRTQSEDAQGVHIYEMVKAFRDLGHEVDIVALVASDSTTGKKIKGQSWGLVSSWIPNWLYEVMTLYYNVFGYLALSRAIKVKKPDMIYERYSLNTFCGIWASRRFGIPMVLEVNLPLYYERSQYGKLSFRRLARFSECWICSHSTNTIVVTQAMKDLLIQEGVPEEKLIVIPNGIDPKRFHPGISGVDVRRKYGLSGKLVLGFVGWFRQWHGLEMLLEIVHESQLAEGNVRLMLVGDGQEYNNLYRYAQAHNLLSAVIFTGPIRRDDVPAYMAAMDIAILPKTNEYGCPMKIVEYMGMGKCILAPDQMTIRELLEDGVTGFLFRIGDKESLRVLLLELIQDPVKREATGRKAHENILERGLFWQTNAQKTLDLVFGKEDRDACHRY